MSYGVNCAVRIRKIPVVKGVYYLRHVRPSATYQRDSHWTDFREIWYVGASMKICQKI